MVTVALTSIPEIQSQSINLMIIIKPKLWFKEKQMAPSYPRPSFPYPSCVPSSVYASL